jgi:hypothetical protein
MEKEDCLACVAILVSTPLLFLALPQFARVSFLFLPHHEIVGDL